jgi:hypothetical protein
MRKTLRVRLCNTATRLQLAPLLQCNVQHAQHGSIERVACCSEIELLLPESAKLCTKGFAVVGVKQSAKNRMVALNDRGRRVGETHPRAELSDRDIELFLGLRAEGYSLSWLAAKFEVSKSQAGRIARGEQRCQAASTWRRALDRKARR